MNAVAILGPLPRGEHSEKARNRDRREPNRQNAGAHDVAADESIRESVKHQREATGNILTIEKPDSFDFEFQSNSSVVGPRYRPCHCVHGVKISQIGGPFGNIYFHLMADRLEIISNLNFVGLQRLNPLDELLP